MPLDLKNAKDSCWLSTIPCCTQRETCTYDTSQHLSPPALLNSSLLLWSTSSSINIDRGCFNPRVLPRHSYAYAMLLSSEAFREGLGHGIATAEAAAWSTCGPWDGWNKFLSTRSSFWNKCESHESPCFNISKKDEYRFNRLQQF